MNSSVNFQIARVLGIPVMINLSWLITMGFVTSLLALRLYPALIPRESPHRDDILLHWVMALSSGLIFFASILLHELAHSIVAQAQGIQVKSITLFIFGGVSQIAGEARRPLHEFAIAIVGPLTSVLLAGVFFAFWWVTGMSDSAPAAIVLQWLFLMNLVIAIFNMAPGFPMDGGRVLRSALWGLSGNLLRATRYATVVGRFLGYMLMFIGVLALMRLLPFIDPWSGLWFGILGLFLENSARQSWIQAKALDVLSQVKAADIMNPEIETADSGDAIRYLRSRGGRRFIFFVADDEENVAGVLTDKEIAGQNDTATAGELMVRTADAPVTSPAEDGASLLQRMESESIWYMPVISEGRVIGVVSKDSLLRELARNFLPRTRLARPS